MGYYAESFSRIIVRAEVGGGRGAENMMPPWVEFPDIPWQTPIGDRQGADKYWYAFARWFTSLSEPEDDEYRRIHPEPGEWAEFYNFLQLKDNDEEAYHVCLNRHFVALKQFLESEYALAQKLELTGNLEEAAHRLAVVVRHRHLSVHFDEIPFDDAVQCYERLCLLSGKQDFGNRQKDNQSWST